MCVYLCCAVLLLLYPISIGVVTFTTFGICLWGFLTVGIYLLYRLLVIRTELTVIEHAASWGYIIFICVSYQVMAVAQPLLKIAYFVGAGLLLVVGGLLGLGSSEDVQTLMYRAPNKFNL